MASFWAPLLRCVSLKCHNLKCLEESCLVLHRRQRLAPISPGLPYSTDKSKSKNADLEEKRQKFKEFETKYQTLLCLEKLTPDEKTIHFLHAEAVERGHFTYDDPFLNEKILTRLRHFLKGKCCGKSCRHCIYEHVSVVDEKKKAEARFNSSFWVYDGGPEEDSLDEFDEQHVVTYGRGPYPRKYAENAPKDMIKIMSKPK